ncbi:MAG: DUF262 domain-containing protein [Treponema sp.]|jgi:uncharacterized protein with ParB-like and HNH nuclease domain|nr:DUF262 domain-containing protein [Treponema sp.]
MENSLLKNKIEATDTNIESLLKGQKFFIDYFQREYRWQDKHIKQLVEDLTQTFIKSFNKGDKRSDVATYQNYYLGPVVFSQNAENGKLSIIDGQQRITSITLFLIYLNNLQKEENNVNIRELVFSEKFGEKSFNMSDEERESCLKDLFEKGDYKIKDDDNETIKNMVERYEDIKDAFPEEINSEVLPYFIDWFKENVIIVKIIAYSDENAYTIFETMNDRGLNLSPTEMLKGYILSKIKDKKQRAEINELWKNEIQKLHDRDETLDISFFQSWFRGKYAVSIRQGKAGSEDQDFEQIGTRFHNWFKDNHKTLFKIETSEEFYKFFKTEFPFFIKWYLRIYHGLSHFEKNMPHLQYINNWGIADSLRDPMLLAPIKITDDESTIQRKIDFVSRFIETFAVLRSINYRKFSQSSIRYTMLNMVKTIRNNNLNKLGQNLTKETEDIQEKWDAILDFGLHGMNGRFVKHLLCRITSYIDNLVGKDVNYSNYHDPEGKPFEIEHIWADMFEEHRDEFDQKEDFSDWRNSIGALLLLPNGTNQSFSSQKYESKVKHYLKENTFAQTLNSKYYINNPNFLNSPVIKKLKFKPHEHFKCEDIKDRLKLVQRICEEIWSIEYYKI